MCGIVGYVGKGSPIESLIDGLKKLEYRGYDSSGIAIKGNNNIQIIKSTGRISELEKKIKEEKLVKSNAGMFNMNEIFDEAEKHKEHGDEEYLDTENFEIDIWKQLIYHRDKWVTDSMKYVIDFLAEKNVDSKE